MQQALELKFDTYSLKFEILEKDKQITYSCSQPAEAQNWQDATNDKFKTFSLAELNVVQSDSSGINSYLADDNQFAVVLLASASEIFSKGNDIADKNLLKELLANLSYKNEIKEVYQDTLQKIELAETAKRPISESSQGFEELSEQLQRNLEADEAKRQADESIKLRQEKQEEQEEQDIILHDSDSFNEISEINNAGQSTQPNNIFQGSKPKFFPYVPKSSKELLEELRNHLKADIFIYRPSVLSTYKWEDRKVGHSFKEALDVIFQPNSRGEFKRPSVTHPDIDHVDQPTVIFDDADVNYDELLQGFELAIDKAVKEGKVHYKDYLNLAQRSDTIETLLRIRRHIMYGISLNEPFSFDLPEFSEDKNHFVLKLWGGKNIEVIGIERIEKQNDSNSMIVQEDTENAEDTTSKPQQFREVTKTITIPQNAYNMLLKIGDAIDGKIPATDALFQIYEIAKAEGGKVSSKPERRDETTSLFYRNYTDYIETCNNAVIMSSRYHPIADANRRIVPSFWVQRNKFSAYDNSRGASATFKDEGESKPSNNIS